MFRQIAIAVALLVPAVSQGRSSVRFDAGPEVMLIDIARDKVRLVPQMPSIVIGRMVKRSGPHGCDVWYEFIDVVKGAPPPPGPLRSFQCIGKAFFSGHEQPERPLGVVDYLYSAEYEMYGSFGPSIEAFGPYSFEEQADLVNASLELAAAKDTAVRSQVMVSLLRSPRKWRRAAAIGAMYSSPPGCDPTVVLPHLPARPNVGEREALLITLDTWLRQRRGDKTQLEPLFDRLLREERSLCGTRREPRCGPRNFHDELAARVARDF